MMSDEQDHTGDRRFPRYVFPPFQPGMDTPQRAVLPLRQTRYHLSPRHMSKRRFFQYPSFPVSPRFPHPHPHLTPGGRLGTSSIR